MTAKNDVTGDALKSKPASDAYRNNYDVIFKKSLDDVTQTSDNSTQLVADPINSQGRKESRATGKAN